MLRGSLSDLTVPDLLQIPVSAGKSGELILATPDTDARLYYVEGRLVHLTMDELRGPDVLSEIVAWTEGEFEFRPDVVTDEQSFEGELGPALEAASQQVEQARNETDDDDETRVRKALYRFLADTEFAIHACVLHPNGTMDVCGAPRESTPAWMERLRQSVLSVVADYPRRQLQRLLLEDEEGTLAVSCLPGGSALLVVAKKDAKLGAVSVATDRLARTVRRIGAAERDA